MIVRFRLGNTTETRPAHEKLGHHVSAGRKRDGFSNFTFPSSLQNTETRYIYIYIYIYIHDTNELKPVKERIYIYIYRLACATFEVYIYIYIYIYIHDTN